MSVVQRLRAWNHARLRWQKRRRDDLRGETFDYARWVAAYDTIGESHRAAFRERAARVAAGPLFSVVMPVYNPDPDWLAEAIESVRAQVYPRWELCIANDRSTDPRVAEVLDRYAAIDDRIRVVHRAENGHISAASNSALDLARGAFVALLDHDDLLPEHALLCVAEVLARHPRAAIVYSDEDKIDDRGQRLGAYFKPAWNPELFRGHNMISHFGVYDTALVREVGGFRVGFEGAQDYDLALRCVDRLGDEDAERIVHIPQVLYHWRIHAESTSAGNAVKPYALDAGTRALREHLARHGIRGDVEADPNGWYRVRYAMPEPAPAVDVVLVGGTADALQRLQQVTEYPSVAYHAVGRSPGACNAAATMGAFLVFIDADAAPRDPAWLRQLIAHACVPGVGAAGARLLSRRDRIVGGGKLLGLRRRQLPFFERLRAGGDGYCGRAPLSQSLSALGAGCIAVRKETFEGMRGFDTGFRDLDVATIDLTRRIAQAGERNLWVPGVAMTFAPSPLRRLTGGLRRLFDERRLVARWRLDAFEDPAYSPNLGSSGRFAFAHPPRARLDAQCEGRLSGTAAP